MTQVTTVFRGGAKPKPFSWSFSRLKNFETCPKRHWHIDVKKDFKEEEGEQLLWGNAVHSAMAARVSKGTPLPRGMEGYEHWCERIVTGKGNIFVEQKLAITKDFGPTAFFANDAWFRGIGDVIKVVSDVALIADWKTGKIIEDSQQLALSAACVFAHYPKVKRVRSEFIWLKEDASSRADFAREKMAEMWRNIWPRIESLEQAYATVTFPPKPNGLCRRYCPVTSCPHNGS